MTRIRKTFQDLIRATDGVGMVEFAFSLPIVLTVLFAGLELVNYVFAHMRINQIAMTVADNAGRVRSVIDESNIYEVFAGAELVGGTLEFSKNGRIVLSSLEPNGQTGAAAGQMINWQRCYGAMAVAPKYGVQGKGRTDSTLSAGMGEAGNQITSATGTAVMFVEVTYNYKPIMFSNFMKGNTLMRYEAAFNVRERTNQTITNAQNLTVRSC
ncbi:MAG: pilus assembly protein [Novosphingobium sp.]|nr:pilus assembly protein [Novosphingobium sp.]